MKNSMLKLGKIGGLLFAGFLMGRGGHIERDVESLTDYDINGDGIKDVVISLGHADNGVPSIPAHRGFYIGYIDGKRIQTVTESKTDYTGKTNLLTKRVTKAYPVILNAAMFTPGIAESFPDYVTGRFYDILPSQDGKTLDFIVSDGTKNNLIFSRTNNTRLPNLEYKLNKEEAN